MQCRDTHATQELLKAEDLISSALTLGYMRNV